jgi:hypothetical protein
MARPYDGSGFVGADGWLTRAPDMPSSNGREAVGVYTCQACGTKVVGVKAFLQHRDRCRIESEKSEPRICRDCGHAIDTGADTDCRCQPDDD